MIRVLIVDDSALIRRVLSRELEKEPDIEVVGMAADPYEARELIARLKPDLITLDIEMPRMDGLTFLGLLMKHHPMPVVLISSVAPENSENALKAYELGAVDVICKPSTPSAVAEVGQRLGNVIRQVTGQRFRAPTMEHIDRTVPRSRVGVPEASPEAQRVLIAIGASTGGTIAVERVLQRLPANCPPVLLAQHMPEHFTEAFAKRLSANTALEVREARAGDKLRPGLALMAPGDWHMEVKGAPGAWSVTLNRNPPVHFVRPSVDVLFNSVARCAGPQAIGVLLTGMGSDGADGMLAMRQAGAQTFAEDESTCVVFGMPRAAFERGGVVKLVPGHEMAAVVMEAARQRMSRAGGILGDLRRSNFGAVV